MELATHCTKEAPEHKASLEAFVQQCWRKVDTHVVLLRESPDVQAMADALRSTEANRLRLEAQAEDPLQRRFVLLSYDLKTAGEASSHPATRMPPHARQWRSPQTMLAGVHRRRRRHHNPTRLVPDLRRRAPRHRR